MRERVNPLGKMKKEISKNQELNTKSLNTAELKSEDVVQLTAKEMYRGTHYYQ